MLQHSHTPQLFRTHNASDRIKDALRDDGHRVWGFTIYRTVYPSESDTSSSIESDWKEFLSRLDYNITQSLIAYNGLDIKDSLALTIFEDKRTLDNITTEQVREKFRIWIAEGAVAKEQGEGVQAGLSQRYRFCIMVDAESLESVVYKAKTLSEPDPNTEGFVKLIKGDWDFEKEKRAEEEEQAELEEAGCPPVNDLDDPDNPPFRSVEGCEIRDVGWMKVAYTQVMVFFYGDRLREWHQWGRAYRRPPEIARG